MQFDQIKDNLKRRITYYIYALVILIVVLFFLLPQVFSIWDKKVELVKTAQQYNKISVEWFTFTELKEEIPRISAYVNKPGIIKQEVENLKKSVEEVYFKKLLWHLSPTFYKMFFENRAGKYLVFLNNKKKEIGEKKLSDNVAERRESLNKILPFYGDKRLIDEEKIKWIYDDTNFILYIERIVEAFNLENSWDIWISNLESVDSEEWYNLEKFSSIDNWIYSFDIELDIKWSKEDFLSFIHYIENVWNIMLAGENIKIPNDKQLRNRIPWDKEINIYAHPIMDIQNITMPEYIDKSLDLREKKTLSEFIKEVSPREEFEASLTVTFFVRWQPEYKKEDFIESMHQKYKKLKWKAANQLKVINNRNFMEKTDKAVIFRRDTQKILNYLNNINKQITNDYKKAKKPDAINVMYKKFENYWEILDKLEATLIKIEWEINLIKTWK